MKKSILRNIPLPEIKDEWKGIISQFMHTNIDYLVVAQKVKLDGIDSVALSMISKKDPSKIKVRLFINNDDFITQDYTSGEVKYKTGDLEHVLCYNWYRYSIMSAESVEVLNDFLGCNEDHLKKIARLQDTIKTNRLENKRKSKYDEIDDKMKYVKKLPKNFEEWLNETVLKKSRYIIYKYEAKKKLDGYCTYCNTDVTVEGAKHNKTGICPNCKSEITFKSEGKVSTIYDKGKASLVQVASSYMYIRYFNVYKSYSEKGRNIKFSYHEFARDVYKPDGKIECFEWRSLQGSDLYRWNPALDRTSAYTYREEFITDSVLYKGNLKRELKNTPYENSCITLFEPVKNSQAFEPAIFFNKYIKYPVIESFFKLKLNRLVHETIHSSFSYNGRRHINSGVPQITKALEINRVQLATLKRLDGGYKILDIIRKAAEHKLNLTDDEIKYIEANLMIDKVMEITSYVSVRKMIKYIDSQGQNFKRGNKDDILRQWTDYIDDCKVLGYDLKKDITLFPNNLYQAHQNSIKLIKVHHDELLDKRIRELHDSLSELYGWEYQGYQIIAPSSFEDMVNEGNILNHCVAKNYVEKFAKGKCIILFLRKAEDIDKPYCTIEINPESNKVVQFKGYSNKTDDEMEYAISAYEKKLKQLKAA